MDKTLRFPLMQPLMTEKPNKNFLGKVISFVTFTRKYIIKEEKYLIWSEYLQRYIHIPFNFWWDGASVPKTLSFAYRAMGVLGLGAIPHDFSYRYAGFIVYHPDLDELHFESCTRKESDGVLQEISITESFMPKSVKTATKTLRLVGGAAWKKWRKEDRDVRKDFPDLNIIQ